MTTNTKKTQEALRMALEALEESHPEAYRNVITAIKEALAEHIPDAGKMVEQSTCKQALQVEQPAQIPDAFDRLMREAGKPTQVPEKLAKYVAALVQGTHEITSVTIRPPQPSKPWVGLTDEQIEEIAARTLFPVNFARAIEARLKELNT